MFQFSEQDRRIFEYSKGERDPQTGKDVVFYGDPLEIERRLRFLLPNSTSLINQAIAADEILARRAAEAEKQLGSTETQPTIDPAIAAEGDAQIRAGQAAHETLTNGIREVFELAEFDPKTGAGCTNAMVIAVWNAYQDWASKKNGAMPGQPTS